jgi:hypothetical protein
LWAPVVTGAMVTAVAVLMFFESGVIRTHFRPSRLDMEMQQAGTAIDRSLGDSDAMLIVVDEYGVTSPVLLYFAHRRGWSFGPRDLTPATIEWLRRRGAGYFVTTEWQDVTAHNPDLAKYVERYRQLSLDGQPPQTRVFDLRQF